MAKYMIQVDAAPDIIVGLLKNPEDRHAAVAPLYEAVGGTLEHYYMVEGGTSAILIAELPDDVSVSTISMALYASGSLKDVKTTRIMTSADAVAVMEKAATLAYRPPSA